MPLPAAVKAEIEDYVYQVLGDTKITLGRDDIIPPIEKELRKLITETLEPLPPEKKKILAAVFKEEVEASDAMNFLRKYIPPGAAKKPIMLMGGQGSGKTTLSFQFAYTQPFDRVIVMQGDEGVDAQMMKGGPRPYPVFNNKGESTGATTTVWQDGLPAHAFRCASQGLKTLLIFEEYYRIKARERSPMISGLSPIQQPDGVWCYRFSTDRITEVKDGLVTNVETLLAPCHLLSILGSTNVGPAFDVQAGDPAEQGRWLPYDLETTPESVKRIIATVLKDYSMSVGLTPKFVKLLEEGIKLKADHFLALEPDTRILCDGIKLAANEMDIGQALLHAALVWVGHDLNGNREPEQLEQLQKLVARHFPVKGKKK